MFAPKNIFETSKVLKYLQERHLLKQYKKAKNYILSNNITQVGFKRRKPKERELYYFRINKQYRAWWKFNQEGNFVVWKIDNHQN